MSYEEIWKVLADLLLEIQESGKKVPIDIIDDLRSAKTMIQVVKADPTQIDNVSKLDEFLRSVESYAILTIEKQGKEKAEAWLEKLKTPKIEKVKEKGEATSRFVSGVPRDKSWVRIQISKDIPKEKLERIIEESKLSHRMHENGYILIYGNENNIKSFVRMMAKPFQDSRKR